MLRLTQQELTLCLLTTSVPARMVQHNKHTVCITAAAVRALVSRVLPAISCRMTAFGSAVTKQ